VRLSLVCHAVAYSCVLAPVAVLLAVPTVSLFKLMVGLVGVFGENARVVVRGELCDFLDVIRVGAFWRGRACYLLLLLQKLFTCLLWE